MPFLKGNQAAKGHGRKPKETPKTFWVLQSLKANGVDLEKLLASSLLKASRGDRQALDLAHLLTKFLAFSANAPKQSSDSMTIETLVINRLETNRPLESKALGIVVDPSNAIEAVTLEGNPPSVNISNSQESKLI